ncbi:GGL domain protein [Ancylostoma ceylanicum]|uniref:Guanine nucleotide-binding protein subunit gamma n=1 Tax=Ancylostoma ceylanicum TaxID=53326 RepID=A0A0D6M056_9BILA|nr:GGL domain protein [Ancylostoma ceylanicum]
MDSMKTIVEQLRREKQVQRKNVSEVARDLLDYCEKHKAGDTLVSGTTDAQNPFREKKGCTVI